MKSTHYFQRLNSILDLSRNLKKSNLDNESINIRSKNNFEENKVFPLSSEYLNLNFLVSDLNFIGLDNH